MNGGKKSLVEVTLRNPLDHKDLLTYTIVPEQTGLAQDWLTALQDLLQKNLLLEKNYCFLGFPNPIRGIKFLCDQLNNHVKIINMANVNNTWSVAGLEPYWIEQHFCEDSVRFDSSYEVGDPDWIKKGLTAKTSTLNLLHNSFEKLQGTVEHISPYYVHADADTKYAIRQLNNLCHELENVILSERKFAFNLEWMRPSQITTFLQAPRHLLTEQHRSGFADNGYDRVLGGVYMHWAQIGKTLFEVFNDEQAPDLIIGQDSTDIRTQTGAVCEAITALKYYSGEFDIEWGQDVCDRGQHPWHSKKMREFESWIKKQKLDPKDLNLSLGYLKIGQVDLVGSFGTTDFGQILAQLQTHLDIYSIRVDDLVQTYNYYWNDNSYEVDQKQTLSQGHSK